MEKKKERFKLVRKRENNRQKKEGGKLKGRKTGPNRES